MMEAYGSSFLSLFLKLLHQQHGCESGQKGYDAVYELCPKETLLAFSQQRNAGMAVLRNAAGKKSRERHDAGGEKSDEDHMRP